MALARRAEHLLEVQTLALVRQVQQLVRMVVLHALHDGGQVRRGVQRRAVALDEDARRQLLAVALLGHGHNKRALALDKHALGLQLLEHRGNVGLRVAFALPDVEADVQIVIVLTQIGHGDLHDVAPQGIVAGTALLHGKRDLVSAGGEGLVLLRAGAGRGVDLLQLGDRERRFLGIRAGEALVKIGQVRLAALQLGDDQADLQAPVAQMNVADDVVTEVAVDALDALADDGGAQVADVQGLCHVRPAIVEHDAAGLALTGHAEALALAHLLQMGGQICRLHTQVDEAGLYGLGRGKDAAVLQAVDNVLRNDERGFVVLLCGGHGTVALKFAQIGAV